MKNTSNLLRKSILGCATAMVLMGGSVTNAAEKPSKATLTLDGSIPVEPPVIVDPENPGEILNPQPEVGLPTGLLNLDYVSDWDFGSLAISGNTKAYFTQQAPFLQISDNRGTNEGWRLSVKQEAQFKDVNNNELKGAELSITEKPTADSLSKSDLPQTNAIDFVPGTLYTLASAKSEAENNNKPMGVGTWSILFEKQSSNEIGRAHV